MASTRHLHLTLVAAVALIVAAPTARAGTITINFDLTSSVISVLGGALTIPPDGNINTANATVTIQGSSLTTASGGPANVSNMGLAADVNGTIGGAVTLTGNLGGSQVGTASASLTGGLGLLQIGTLTLHLSGLVNCFGGLCGVIGTFPISVMSSNTVVTGGSLGIGGLGTLSGATLNGLLSLTLSGNTVQISVVGQEVSRTFVPEPNTFGLVGLGLLGLAGVGWRRSRAL